MKIGVLSDTHVNSLEDLSDKIVNELSGTELIIHAGDYVDKRMVDDLQKLGNFRGVHGNMDSIEVKETLPSTDIVEFGGIRIGITHPVQGGPPFMLDEIVKRKFANVDIIIYGHSHASKNEMQKGVLLFNPGSATGKFADCKSFGLLNINEQVEGKIIKI
jgi:putative phosphoesterase